VIEEWKRGYGEVIIRIWKRRIRYARWLTLVWWTWLALFSIIGAMLYAGRPPITAAHLNCAGTFLQAVGTSMGFVALNSTRNMFRVKTLREAIRCWWSKRPRDKGAALVGEGRATSSASGALGVGYVSPPKLSVEERLRRAEASIKDLQEEAVNANIKHEAAFAAIRTEIAEKSQANAVATSAVSDKLLASQTGGIWQAMTSLTMILVGTVLGGLAPNFEPANQSPNAIFVSVQCIGVVSSGSRNDAERARLFENSISCA
jgi:hypothetical protein